MKKSAKNSMEIEALRQRIEQWRQTRETRRAAIPEAIWAAATELARTSGVYPVSRALRLNHQRLSGRAATKTKKRRATFVELKPAPLATATPHGAEVEVTNGRGEKLVIRVSGGTALDVPGLAAAFLGRRA